jgi:hypothetical protein
MKKSLILCAALLACAFGFQSCDKVDNPGSPVTPAEPIFEETFVYDFAEAAKAGENPANFNGNQNNGQGFNAYSVKIRNDYKGYTWAEGSVLPEECHVWRRSDRINGNIVEGGLKCPNDREMAIDGLEAGSYVQIFYEGGDVVWAIGDGSSEQLEGARATATINGIEAVTGETVIPSESKIVVTSVTPAVNGTGYIVFKVKKNMIISKIVIGNVIEL